MLNLFQVFFLPFLGCVCYQQTPLISVNTTGPFSGLHAWVAVAFGPVQASVRESCWLGVFPASANLSAAPWAQINGGTSGNVPNTVNSPMKFIDCRDADPLFISQGSGHLEVRLLNVRQPLVIALFSNGSAHPVHEATSPVLAFLDYSLPMHGHIALASEPGQMSVQWTSLNRASPTLQWSYQRSGPPYEKSVAASSVKYGMKDYCGKPANREGYLDSGFQHVASVAWPSYAKPGQTIFYRFGSADQSIWSEERSFLIPKLVGSNVSTFMLVAADIGATEPDNFQSHWSNPLAGNEGSCVVSNVTSERMQHARQSDAVLLIGDLAYATGYLAKWELFMDQVEGLASRTPYMISQGNHERDWPGTGSSGRKDSGGECGIAAQARFKMPGRGHNRELGWYSFDVGSVHVVMLDTELACGSDSKQLSWLESDLKAVDRARTPWLVVTGHRPMYKISSGGSVGPDLSNAFCLDAANSNLETILNAYEVDLCLWGHVHNALVTCPVYNGTCVKEPRVSATRPGYKYLAPIHAVIGNAGMELSGVDSKPAPWVRWQSNTWGWNTLTADGSRNLRLTFYDERGQTLYKISIESQEDDSSVEVALV